MAKLGVGDELTEDSMDGAPPSVGSDSCPASMPHTPSSALSTPSTVKKPIKIFQKRMVTGYIIYSGEVRKNVAAKHPDATFGEVSRLVGNDWRNLPSHVKSEYEERSQRLNEETAAEMARNGDSTPGGVPSGDLPQGDVIFECFWKKCDWQGEEIGELTEHLLAEPHGHVLTTINPNGKPKKNSFFFFFFKVPALRLFVICRQRISVYVARMQPNSKRRTTISKNGTTFTTCQRDPYS